MVVFSRMGKELPRLSAYTPMNRVCRSPVNAGVLAICTMV